MVDLFPDAEQEAIVAAVRDVLRERLPLERFRGRRAGRVPSDLSLWRELAALGWFALGLPEQAGGSGCGLVEESLLCVELGRHLVSPAAPASMLAAHLLHEAGHAALPSIVAGERHACFANAVPAPGTQRQGGQMEVQLIDSAPDACVLLLLDDEILLLDAGAVSDRRPVTSLDAAVALERACVSVARPLARVPASGVLALRASVLLGALATGIAQATRDMATSYAKERQQFGKPIGSFQAVKHHCANMAVQAEACATLVSMAALTVANRHDDAAHQAASAHLVAARAAHHNSALNIQVHGGIGFTEDYDAHLYLKRSHVLSTLLGGLPRQERLLAECSAA